jgi:hypothetical protein
MDVIGNDSSISNSLALGADSLDEEVEGNAPGVLLVITVGVGLKNNKGK